MISSATVLVFAAFVIAVVTFLVMMIALYVGLINQLSFDKGFYGVVAVALCAGIKIYACFRKRGFKSAVSPVRPFRADVVDCSERFNRKSVRIAMCMKIRYHTLNEF